MERSVMDSSFLKLLELNPVKDLHRIREPLSTLLDGFLKNLKSNKYPAAYDFLKAAIFIQNAVFIYSKNVDDLFTFVTELNRSLYSINLQPISNAITPSTPNISSVPSENITSVDSEESDEQVTASKSRKHSRKKIEEHDSDPIDIADPWTTDNIDEAQEEPSENQSEFFFDQDLEVETVLAQCDNFESTSNFVRRDDVNEDRSKDLAKKEYRILAQMDDDGFICTDFNIFDSKKSKRFSSLMSNTVDLLEASELTECVDRDVIALEPTSVVHAVETRDSGQDENMELCLNPQKRLDLNRKDDEFYNFKVGVILTEKDENFRVSLLCLDEYSKKHMRKAMLHKYALYRAIHYSDQQRLCDAVHIHGSKPYPIDSDTEKVYLDPDVQFEGFQTLYDADWCGWPCEEGNIEKQDSTLEIITTDVAPDLDESEFVQEPEKIRKPGIEDIHKNVFTKKAARWIEIYKPIVEKTTNRKKFNIRDYGDKVMETITCNIESPEKTTESGQKTLEDVLGTQTFQEASKYFLAVLVLANNGNLELEKPSSDPLTVNKCNIKFLNNERHHDKLDQDIAVHSLVPDKKTKKK